MRTRPLSRLGAAALGAAMLVVCDTPVVHAAKRRPPTAPPPPPPVLRFPDEPSENLVGELAQAGRVTAALPPDPAEWKRWGRASPDDQDLAVRAIADALAKARLPIDLSAMVLAIARVESGFNPFSEHPVSTACGIFQFVEGTWQSYASPRDLCLDPYLNAWAGVKHLSALDTARLRDARKLLQGVPDELQRTEYLYRLLYAYHYHGSRSIYAALGGSLTAQQAADSGVPYLKRYYSILKKATYVPPPPAARKPAVRKGRPAPRPRAVHRGKARRR